MARLFLVLAAVLGATSALHVSMPATACSISSSSSSSVCTGTLISAQYAQHRTNHPPYAAAQRATRVRDASPLHLLAAIARSGA